MSSILFAGLFAGLVAVLVTVAIERWGGKIGGLLGTLPTTIVPASIGIWLQASGVEDFRSAMYITPAGMLLDAGFLFLWRWLPGRLPERWKLGTRLAVVTVVSLVVWILAAMACIRLVGDLEASGLPLAFIGWGLTAAIVVSGVLACWNDIPSPGGKREVGVAVLMMRGLLAAVAIGVAVWMTRVAGPLAAGVASVFPAIFLTTMVSLWLSQGEAVQAGAVGPMMLGSSAVAGFAVLAASTFPAMGVVWGSVAAWLGSAMLFTVPAWFWLRSKR